MEQTYFCCNKEMIHTNLGYYECDICKKQIEDDLGLIKSTLDKHPGSNAIELAKLTKLPTKVILKYLNDGAITAINQPKSIRGYYLGAEVTPKWHIDVKNIFPKS